MAHGSKKRQEEKCLLYDFLYMRFKNMQRDSIILKVSPVGNWWARRRWEWCRHLPTVSTALWLRWDKFTQTTESCGGKGTVWPLSQGLRPLPWRAFIAFLGTLHWGWSLFTMHRFALGAYLLQKTKERMLLITSERKDICKCKGKSGWTGYIPYLGGLA